MKRLFTLFFIAVLSLGLFSSAHAQDSVLVTFNVDFSLFADTSSTFNANEDSVFITGDFLGWNEPGTNEDLMMTDVDADSVYTFQDSVAKNDTIQYKYFYVPSGEGSSWSYGDWDGTDNRVQMVGENDTTFNEFYKAMKAHFKVLNHNDEPLEGARVVVNTDDTLKTDADGMAMWPVLAKSTFTYCANAMNYVRQTGEKSIGIKDSVYTIHMEPNMVTFMLNMEDSIDNVDLEANNVYVTGSFTGWAEPGSEGSVMLTDSETDGDSIFTAETMAQGDIAYKYFLVPEGSTSWDYGEWDSGDDRTATINGNNVVIKDDWAVMGFAQKFHIMNEAGEGISGAHVMVDGEENYSGMNGFVTFNLDTMKYNLQAYSDHYVRTADSVMVTEADDTLHVTMPEGVAVTFELDMNAYADTSSVFEPDMESIYITGSLLGWAEPGNPFSQEMGHTMMKDGHMVYTKTMTVPADSSYEYKFFRLPDTLEHSWSYGEWDGTDNRSLAVGANDTTVHAYWGAFEVEFHVMEDDAAVEGASITLGEGTLMTNADGVADTTLVPGTAFDYTVSHADYNDFSGSETVNYEKLMVSINLIPTSVEEVVETNVKVYPNPVANTLYLENLGNINRIEISNLVGQRVKTISNFDRSKVMVNMSDLRNGVYIVSMRKDDGSVKAIKLLKR